jgi:hypothetical protein
MKDGLYFNRLKKMSLCFVAVLSFFKVFVVVLCFEIYWEKKNEGEGDKSERREKETRVKRKRNEGERDKSERRQPVLFFF